MKSCGKGMVWGFLAMTAFFCGLAAHPVFADDVQSKIINDPSVGWVIFGEQIKSAMVKDASVTGGTAVRIQIDGQAPHPWDAGATSVVAKPIAQGDILLLAFWGKVQDVPAGSDGADIVAKLQENAAPYLGLSGDTPLHIGKTWKLYYVVGKATKDYPAGAVGAALQLATAKQVIDFGPIFILNYGPNYDMQKLPRN